VVDSLRERQKIKVEVKGITKKKLMSRVVMLIMMTVFLAFIIFAVVALFFPLYICFIAAAIVAVANVIPGARNILKERKKLKEVI